MMPPESSAAIFSAPWPHNPAILDRFRTIGAYIRQLRARSILSTAKSCIHRTTARCGCEYEWGVHAVAFGRPLGLSDEQLRATVHGTADDPSWSPRQALLVRLVDELHDSGTATDDLFAQLAEEWQPAELVELVATAGFYHFVSFMANALGWSARSTASASIVLRSPLPPSPS